MYNDGYLSLLFEDSSGLCCHGNGHMLVDELIFEDGGVA
jgi:hypothetical protein